MRERFFELWLILSAFGVFFALYSWGQEISRAEPWKGLAAILSGALMFTILRAGKKI